MEHTTINKDELLICVKAAAFPDQIQAAFQELEKRIDRPDERNHYGLSCMNAQGGIDYWAAATALNEREPATLQCESFVLKAGTYASVFLPDFMQHLEAVGETFQQLIALPDLDPETRCVEWYPKPQDLYCMVRLKG